MKKTKRLKFKKKIKGVKIDKNGALHLKSSYLKGEDLAQRLTGKPKKKLSKGAAARKKANRNRVPYNPILSTGMTQ